MNAIFFKKSIVESLIATIAIVSSVLTGCQSDLHDDSSYANFTAFEKEFSKSLSSEKDVVRLIGFKTNNISDDEKNHFRMLISEYGEELKKINIVISDDFSFYRQYFPLHTAIVEYNGKTHTANEKGVVSIPNLKDISKIKVIGRKRSETVHGTGSNIIEKDRILLRDEFKQEARNGVTLGYSIEGNACIFDFHALTSMNESCCSNRDVSGIPRLKSANELGVSCADNHGGFNCTYAFGGHWQGKCYPDMIECMDYNGYGNEDCVHNHIYFPGSDCSIAMAMGHCWNELM